MQVNVKLVEMPSAPYWKLAAQPVSQEPGGEVIQIDLPENARVADLVSRLRVEPDKILVNGNDASEQTPLNDGDAVALIGPAAGKE